MKVIGSMFDGSGLALLPWAKAGYKCVAFNFDDADHGDYSVLNAKVSHPNIEYVNVWIDSRFRRRAASGEWGNISFILAFPPCTDLAVSGAPAFPRKRASNPDFQIDAVRTCRIAQRLADDLGVPYVIENPVSVLASMWRKPDYVFNPWEYGGYLPESDEHPWFPDYINPRDAYPKKTCFWTGNGFVMPEKIPVYVEPGYSKQYHKLGGKSKRTKVIRSLTPRGVAQAIYEANHATL